MHAAKLFIALSVIYGVILFSIIYTLHQDDGEKDASTSFLIKPTTENFVEPDTNDFISQAEEEGYQFRVDKTTTRYPQKEPIVTVVGPDYNPFTVLGAYPDPTPYINGAEYDKPSLGMINDDEYCMKVDKYNLEHPEHMFEKMDFYTDFFPTSVMKTRVMNKLGTILMPTVHRNMAQSLKNSRLYPIDTNITLFHITADQFYKYHEIGKHYLCATQVFSHIPNHTDIIQKDHFPQSIQNYRLKYQDKPQCFEKGTFYPATFRLFVEAECNEFFDLINSQEYIDSLETEPIQYLKKIGNGAHKAEGVFLVDKNETLSLKYDFENGNKCGQIETNLIVQKYINNPMLLDNNNKFHMRVYVFIASTNPMIAFYHDGYLRASIFPFNKFSEDRATHLTNLLMGNSVANALNGTNNTKLQNMTAKQLEDYYLWSFQDLEKYLIESGKTNDTNWLNNHLRPALQRAFVHILKMTSMYYWKQSNVYEMFGCDFMLDEDMNVWFIEANGNPLLDGPLVNMITQMLKDLFEIEYAYYRSRMRRVLDVIQRMQNENNNGTIKDLNKWKGLYQEAAKNRLEPEYKINEKNSWKKIMDENLPGAEAYFGHIAEECIDN